MQNLSVAARTLPTEYEGGRIHK